jgi:hypothetical protein
LLVHGSIRIRTSNYRTDPDPGGYKTYESGTLINTCDFFCRIRRESPPTSSVSSSPVSSWRTAGPSPTTTSRRSPPCTSCYACAAGSLNPRSASSPRSTTATRQGWEKSGFKKKTAQWVFFIWFFAFFLFICLPRRECFLGFFQFQEYF